ncbi:MAG: tRNA guanosine(34) transglycosylase Tgt [Bacteroidales bacterium]|jgi:queuine tRNA-ribosyltransferase|nr:tRNA guanosine(34) transglycosylase Tgt [Bacteroidales bacterium]MDD4214627.1 tRNA guanosine(34) transglycosylase Tgt [Bacteroidales bacterium]
MKFTLTATDKASAARAGMLETAHGIIETPVFMPVGTSGSVKALHQKELAEDVKAQIILGNTYHLYLRPGTDILEEAGGLHKFMGWNKPILTDSGGYQVYSLKTIRKIKDDGVIFHSHIDGSKHIFTPENTMDIQRKIGADIIMAFDECAPYPCDYEYAKKSMKMTHKWLERCMKHFNNTKPLYGYEQSLFPIVQGSVFDDLRKISAETASEYNPDGIAIGGLSVGEPTDIMYDITAKVCSVLPQNKPRYLMGVGTPANILEAIALGVDMFDCVMPTRNGRNGWLFTRKGRINIRNEKWKNDFSPIDDDGLSYVDRYYNKAYLRHLFASNEILAAMIASQHNLAFYCQLVQEAREHIISGSFLSWKNNMVKRLENKL